MMVWRDCCISVCSLCWRPVPSLSCCVPSPERGDRLPTETEIMMTLMTGTRLTLKAGELHPTIHTRATCTASAATVAAWAAKPACTLQHRLWPTHLCQNIWTSLRCLEETRAMRTCHWSGGDLLLLRTLQPWEPPTSPWPKTRSDTLGRTSERRTDLFSSGVSLYTLEIWTHGKLSRQHVCPPFFVLKELSLRGERHFKSTLCVSIQVLACLCVFVHYSDGGMLLFSHYWHICEVLKYPLSNNSMFTPYFH